MKVKSLAINAAATLLLDKNLWTKVKELVSNINPDDSLSSQEKHDKVMSDLKEVFSEIGTAVLNLGVSLAVVWLKSKTQ